MLNDSHIHINSVACKFYQDEPISSIDDIKDDIKKCAKVLVLGTADAGKSTLIRHMRQLHGEQFRAEEISHFKNIIRICCLEYLISIIIWWAQFSK